jgi:hypothetical protein
VKKKLLGIGLAVMMMVTAMAMPVMADAEGTQELTGDDKSSDTDNTEVTANIDGSSGDVYYIVTVPKKIDFGKLRIPADANGDYLKYIAFTVSCVEMSGISQVLLSVMNEGSLSGEANQQFHIDNDTTNKKLTYGLAVGAQGETKIDVSGAMPVNGYQFTIFTSAGQSVPAYAGIKQSQLYGEDINTLIGTYSGTLVFTTSVPQQQS